MMRLTFTTMLRCARILRAVFGPEFSPKSLVSMKSTLIQVAFLLCAPLYLAAQSAEEYFEKGRKYHTGEGQEQDIGKALQYYQEALKRNGELYAALYNSGLIYHGRTEYARAQTLFIKAAKVAATIGENADRYGAMARNGLGSTYQNLGKKTQAEKQFSIAKRMYPTFVEAHYNHINLLILQERSGEARKALAVAEKLAPSARYGKFKSRLRIEEERQDQDGMDGVGGIIVFVVLVLLYSLFLRRRALQKT